VGTSAPALGWHQTCLKLVNLLAAVDSFTIFTLPWLAAWPDLCLLYHIQFTSVFCWNPQSGAPSVLWIAFCCIYDLGIGRTCRSYIAALYRCLVFGQRFWTFASRISLGNCFGLLERELAFVEYLVMSPGSSQQLGLQSSWWSYQPQITLTFAQDARLDSPISNCSSTTRVWRIALLWTYRPIFQSCPSMKPMLIQTWS